jgi:hypothetical protein
MNEGVAADRAADMVRETRSIRTVETQAQEAFVRQFTRKTDA